MLVAGSRCQGDFFHVGAVGSRNSIAARCGSTSWQRWFCSVDPVLCGSEIQLARGLVSWAGLDTSGLS